MILEIYDLECLSNFFSYTGKNPKTKEYFVYSICQWNNQIEELYKHLQTQGLLQIGFNNLGYDYTLEHHLINHYNEYKQLSGQEIAQKLYKKSQEIIETQFSEIAKKNRFIPQIDLYKIWHYNNKARNCSLKQLEIAMRMSNVEEMPIHHTTWCNESDEKLILNYNLNDVETTEKFFFVTLGKTDYPLYSGKNKIKLRIDLNKKFDVDVLNMGDVPMGEELMLQLYSRSVGINPYILKKSGGTARKDGIFLKDCIPKWCNIKNKEFIKFLNIIKKTKVTGAKKEFEYSVIFHNYKFDFGLGGSHGSAKPQIWESNSDWVIADYDIGSLYPSISKSLGLYPEHLGKEFNKQYCWFIDKRLSEKHKPKNERDNVLIEGFKLILNGTYGKSKEETSFLYDPLYTFKTTIAGQIFICMWAERWVEAVPELKFIQTNTDGQTIFIPRSKIDKIRTVNDQLTKETGLTIEETIYNKMCVRDVNNYIAVYEDSTREKEHIKLKGDYEIYKEFHKDPSMRIVPYAVKEYFVYGTPIEQTIKNCNNIYDFCLQLKCNSSSVAKFRHFNKNKDVVTDTLARNTRYYIGTGLESGTLYKEFNDGREIGVNVGFNAIIFNTYEDKKDYKIDYKFYLSEARKLINCIENKQLNLFNYD